MAVRLVLEFMPPQRDRRNTCDMCAPLVTNPALKTAATIAPSEPIFAEGLLIRDREAFDSPRALLNELDRLGLDKGNRELLMTRDVIRKHLYGH
jgi:hypothetical protein